MFIRTNYVTNERNNLHIANQEFLKFTQNHLLCEHEDDVYELPTHVFFYAKSSMGPKFVLRILLSLGRFQTEHQILLKGTLKEYIREAKLIGINDDKESLIYYSNEIMNLFVRKQTKCFPNGMRVIGHCIILSGGLFDSVMIEDNIPITEIPAM